MKKFLLLAVAVLTLVTSSVFAYDPTTEDRDLRNEARNKVDNLYPGQVDKLLEVYGKLDALKAYIEVVAGERGLWFVEELKEIFVEQLFENNEVCIQGYTQIGDTVEVMYTVRDGDGDLLRETTDPVAFNPGSEQVWKSLDDTVYGLQVNETAIETVDTLKVAASEGDWTKEFPRDEIDFTSTPIIGTTYAFGSTTIPGAIIGTVIAVDDTYVTFDFEDAPIGEEVVLRVGLEQLKKGCSSVK